MIKKHPRFATRDYWTTQIDIREEALDAVRELAREYYYGSHLTELIYGAEAAERDRAFAQAILGIVEE